LELTFETVMDISAEANSLLFKRIKEAYKTGNLKEYLSRIGMLELYPEEIESAWTGAYPNGKILVLGEAACKVREIEASLKSVGIPKDKIEMRLGYDELKSFNFKALQYNPSYRLILIGPMPHSTAGKGDFSSAITMMEKTDGYTKMIRMTSNGQLKITKTNLKEVVGEEVRQGFLKY